MSKRMRANGLLLLTALIWGLAFVAQDVAMDSLPPFSFNAARMLLGALCLVPLVMVMDARAKAQGTQDQKTGTGIAFRQLPLHQKKELLMGGLCCGACLAVASACQQIGIQMGTTAGKAGFITALYIVLVPLLGLFAGKKVTLRIWIAVAISAVGLYFLCIDEGFRIQAGDLLIMVCALCFALHILVIDHFSRCTDCVKLSCIQFFVTALICTLMALVFEAPTWQGFLDCMTPILYAGIGSCAIGYTLQIVAQKDTNPTVASLILCLESVFAVLAGWLLLGDHMSLREYAGCFAVLLGIVLAQLPDKKTSDASIERTSAQ